MTVSLLFWTAVCLGSITTNISPVSSVEFFKSGKKKKKKFTTVHLTSGTAWAGGTPDARFDAGCSARHEDGTSLRRDSDASLHEDSTNGSNNDEDGSSFLRRVFVDDEKGLDLSSTQLFQFELYNRDYHVSTWTGISQAGGDLFVEVPDGDLPAGSKECFVSLLEYAEEVMESECLFLCVDKHRNDRSILIRTFMFLGFEVVNADMCKRVPKNENYIFLGYTF